MKKVSEIIYNVEYFAEFSKSWTSYGTYRVYSEACSRFDKLRKQEEESPSPHMIRLSTTYVYE